MSRIVHAFQAFWQVLTGATPWPPVPPARPSKAPAPAPPPAPAAPPPPPPPDRFGEGAVYTLLLLQREARLVDFLQENLEGVDDALLGAAVRRIHADSARVLRDTFAPTPIFTEGEGESLTLPAAQDISQVRLTGQVPAAPPFSGTLRHRGWRAGALNLPERATPKDSRLIQPAELEC